MSHSLDRLLAVEEDSAFTDGDELVPVGGHIQDTLASSAGDGDYVMHKYTLKGELYTHDTDANSKLTTINTSITDITQQEDDVHASGDKGIMSLAVRHDAGTALAADGDYIPLTTTADGSLRVAATVEVPVSNTAISSQAVTVGTTEVLLPATPLTGRDEVEIQNRGPKPIFVGPTGVTTASGLEIGKRSNRVFKLGPSVDIYGISTAAGNDVRVFEMS